MSSSVMERVVSMAKMTSTGPLPVLMSHSSATPLPLQSGSQMSSTPLSLQSTPGAVDVAFIWDVIVVIVGVGVVADAIHVGVEALVGVVWTRVG